MFTHPGTSMSLERMSIFTSKSAPRPTRRGGSVVIQEPLEGSLRVLYVSRFGSPSDPAALSAHFCIGSSPEQLFYPWKLHRGKKTVTPELNFQVMTTDPAVHRRLALDE